MKIYVNNHNYRVTTLWGFSHYFGAFVFEVATDAGPRLVHGLNGNFEFLHAIDRLGTIKE